MSSNGRVVVYLDSGNPVRRSVELAERTRALLLVVGTRGTLTLGG